MGTIEEVMEDVKSVIGDKGFLVLIVGVVLIFIYNLSKGSSNDSGTVNVTALTSYPDAVTNANVIIDTLQNSIDYSEGEIKEEIQGLDTGLKEYLEQNFTATNDFINVGFESSQKLMEENFDTIIGGLDNIESNTSNLNGAISNMKNELNKTQNTSPSTTAGYYTFKTKSGYNANTSIVDALKVIGVDSSMANRTKIAKANGINNYTGTYSQNVTLLSKLKQGKLIKV